MEGGIVLVVILRRPSVLELSLCLSFEADDKKLSCGLVVLAKEARQSAVAERLHDDVN